MTLMQTGETKSLKMALLWVLDVDLLSASSSWSSGSFVAFNGVFGWPRLIYFKYKDNILE